MADDSNGERDTAIVNGHVTAAIIWIAVLIAGYFVIDHFAAPDPIVRTLQSGHREIVIPVARDGHYYVEGTVNGQRLTFLVDTGASYVSVGSDLAHRANLPEGQIGVFNTANGAVKGRVTRADSTGQRRAARFRFGCARGFTESVFGFAWRSHSPPRRRFSLR